MIVTYSLSIKTSYCKILWSLEAAKFGFRLFNHSELWQATRQQGCQILQQYNHYNTQSRSFEMTDGFPLQRAMNAEFCCIHHLVKKIIELPVMWNVLMPMWRHCYDVPTSILKRRAGNTGVFTVSTIMSSPGPTSALIDTAGSVWTRITIQPYVTRSLTTGSATGKRFGSPINIYIYIFVMGHWILNVCQGYDRLFHGRWRN